MNTEYEMEKKLNLELITLIEQTYIENYYGHNLHLFERNKITSGTDAD
jgi:predicted GNAT superfamily acetyltransferase